jgi:hypothetical protein
MNEEALPRRIMYVMPVEQWKTGRPKHAGNKLERMREWQE